MRIFGRLALILTLSVVLWGNTAQAQCDGVTHVVRTGENLFRIGLQYGLTVDQVAAANGITNVNSVQIAQTLCIPTGGGSFGTGGSTAQTGTNSTSTNSSATANNGVGGRVMVNSYAYAVDRAPSVEQTVAAGTVDPLTGQVTTATIGVDAANNLLHVQTGGHIPFSQSRVYVSAELGDVSTSLAGYLIADANGFIDGYVVIPFLGVGSQQYVMVRAYDGRMTWGIADINVETRFP